MKDPVRILNEDIGYRTHACCEGHFDDDLGFITSYISIVGIKPKPFGDFLIDAGFVFGKANTRIFDIQAKDFSIYFSVKGLDSNIIKLTAMLYANDTAVLNVSALPEPKSQKVWDIIRDGGWYLWLNALTFYKKNIDTHPKPMATITSDFLLDICKPCEPDEGVTCKQFYKAYKAYYKDKWLCYIPTYIDVLRDVIKLMGKMPEFTNLRLDIVEHKVSYKCKIMGIRLPAA